MKKQNKGQFVLTCLVSDNEYYNTKERNNNLGIRTTKIFSLFLFLEKRDGHIENIMRMSDT